MLVSSFLFKVSIQLVQPIRCIFHGIQASNLHHKSIRPMNQSSFIFSWLVFLWKGGGKRVKNSWTLSISSLGRRHNSLRSVRTSLQNLPTLKTSFAPSNYEKNKKGLKKTCFFQKNCFFPLKKTRLKKTCFLPIPTHKWFFIFSAKKNLPRTIPWHCNIFALELSTTINIWK